MNDIQTEQDRLSFITESVKQVASFMITSVVTAPKACWVSSVTYTVVSGNSLQKLASLMIDEVKGRDKYLSEAFIRDANTVKFSSLVVLVGVNGKPKNINCGGCGFKNCAGFAKVKKKEADFTGPNCILQVLDLGIALGSAVKMASQFNIDNRIMYTVGVTAKRMKLLDGDIILGIPLSVSEKNPYFDRKPISS
jgi:uncharacterized ferredoxin-like protein